MVREKNKLDLRRRPLIQEKGKVGDGTDKRDRRRNEIKLCVERCRCS